MSSRNDNLRFDSKKKVMIKIRDYLNGEMGWPCGYDIVPVNGGVEFEPQLYASRFCFCSFLSSEGK